MGDFMVYLDYNANTMPDESVINNFVDISKKYIANPNSSHKLGKEAMDLINKSKEDIAKYFNCKSDSLIFTSGASEANNLVIKGVALRNKELGKHIIISSLEHSSVVAPANYLTTLGYQVSVVPTLDNGKVDLEFLEKEIREDTILVSICSVDSELGIIQPIKEIVDIVKKYPNCLFHTDATQAIGKVNIDFTGVDFLTFAPHKFYGLNGSGCLINFNNNKLVPLIHGGKSVTIYRSGTPDVAAISSLSVAFRLAYDNLDSREKYITGLNKYLRKELSLDYVHINSPEDALCNVLNISLIGIPKKYVLEELEENDIYISSTSACSLENAMSKSVYAVTGDEDLANNSLRISLSYLTTMGELKYFISTFKKICGDYNENNKD